MPGGVRFTRDSLMKSNIYGFSPDLWQRAKEEAVVAIVRRRSTIYYSDLAKQIGSIKFGPHDYAFHYLLYEISLDEDEAGRSLLSALVVRQEDGLPGQGFFDMAKQRGRDTSDTMKCWAEEANIVLSHGGDHPLAS